MADGASDFFDKVSFLNKYPLLAKATTDTDKPTPGHVINDINMTFESGSICLQLLDYLLKRLDKKSPHVKLKVLKIVHYIIVNGHVEFRHALRKKDTLIKDAVSFSGPPDALRGNAMHLAVRKEATDILQLLYNPSLMNADLQADRTKIMKKEDVIMPGMGSSGKSGKYVGFGNLTAVSNRSLTERVVGSLVGMMDKFMGYPDPDALSLDSDIGNYKAVKLIACDPATPAPTTPVCSPAVTISPSLASTTGVAAVAAAATAVAVPVLASSNKGKDSFIGYRPGRAGGGWDEEADENSMSSQKSSISLNVPEAESFHSNSVSTDSLEKEDLQPDYKAEEDMLNDYLSIPSPCKSFQPIHHIINKWQNLNWEKVVELFEEKLRNSEFDTQKQVLLFLEVITYRCLLPVDKLKKILQATLLCLKESDCEAVRSKARKLVLILQKSS